MKILFKQLKFYWNNITLRAGRNQESQVCRVLSHGKFCVDWVHRKIFGNLFEEKRDEIWEKYRIIIENQNFEKNQKNENFEKNYSRGNSESSRSKFDRIKYSDNYYFEAK